MSRDNWSSPPFALGIYRHVEELIHPLDRSQTTILNQPTFFLIFMIQKFQLMIFDIYTSRWQFYCLTFKFDLDLQLIWTNVSNEQLCQIILKSMHKCRSYGFDKLNLWPFHNLIFRCDLDLQPTWTNVSNGTATPQREQLCQIILKSMHKCRSDGLDKLSLWRFYHLTITCDLDLQPTWTNVSNGTYTPQGQLLCQIILKSMHKCISYGPDKSGSTRGCTHTHAHTMNKNFNNYVSLTTRGLEKIVSVRHE